MPRLADGSIVPSFMSLHRSTDLVDRAAKAKESDAYMHVGYVVGVHYPADPGYESTQLVTYDVICPMPFGNWLEVYNVRWGANLGGSIKDFSRMRLCVAQGWKPGQQLTDIQRKQASCVIVQMENGYTQKGYIIGFAEHPDTVADSKSLGHNYRFDYNGVRTEINKEGELSFTFTGSILDANSNMFIEPPPETTGSFIKLDMTGSIILDDVKGESVKLDKSTGNIQVTARKMATNITEGDWDLSTKGKTNILAQNNAIINSQKKVYVGKEGSTEPLVQGNKLAQALGELVDTILNTPLIGQAGPFPCRLHPSWQAKLIQWKTKHKPKTAPFLSKKGYVE